VTEQAIEEPPIEATRARRRASPPSARETALELAHRFRWVLAAIGLLALSTVVVLWARARPGYDPYGWLVWGKLTIHLKLDTNGAPSWKPLPFLFTVPYAVVGHYQLWLWMITSVAISLSGVVFAWRIAFKLTASDPARRYAAYAAGLFAAVFLLGIRDYTHFILSSQSDTMIVSLCLGAIDCQLSGHRRWAFWLWLLAGLGRPEAWPFLAAYSLYLWRSSPAQRRMIVGGLILIPLFWFGIPAVTSKSAFTAGNIAQNSPRELKSNKFFGTLDRFLDLHEMPVQLAALFTVVLAAWRLHRGPQRWPKLRLAFWRMGPWPHGEDAWCLLLAAGMVVWVLVEAAFALHGWPAVPRYLFEPVAVMCVLAGVFVGRVILDLPPLVARFASRFSPRPIGARLAGRLGAWAAVLVVVLLAGSMLPAARSRLHIERRDLTHERERAKEINLLSTVVARLGTSRILACGQPNIPIGYQSQLAWYMGIKIGELYVSKTYERKHPHPLVNMYPLSNGWKTAAFVPPGASVAERGRCTGLHVVVRS
jgi:hypothetical protein